MQLYPAIDLKNGQCVRLRQGLFDQMKVYSDVPEAIALHWQEEGATFLHLVDLDGALVGHSVNHDVIKRIVSAVEIPIQIGGGIRTKEDIKKMLKLGVSRIIIGTKAVEYPEFIQKMISEFGTEHIVVGVDAKDGMVAIQGWERVSDLSAANLCERMRSYGVKHIVYTDISRDGMLMGPNVAYTKKLTQETGMDIIASGGVSCMEDLVALHEAKIKGVIIGKALYEQRINLRDAVDVFE